VFFVAPSDLAATMGKIGRLGDPEVVQTIDQTLARIVAAGRTAGTLRSNNQGAVRFLALGVRFLACSVLPILSAGIRDL
jgi:4-hydroxy-2-oxoheptanedioate aldolase